MEVVEEIARNYNISLELAKILFDKGVKNLDLAEATFSPVIENLQPPSTLPDLIPAVERTLRAVGKDEKIVIFGHEDADGITSTAIMLKALKLLGSSPYHYIPSKKNEAYGISKGAVDYIIDRYNATLILTIDSSSSSSDVIEYCKEKGIDVIISDHHEIRGSIPNTYVVNPKRGGDSYSYLAGCGVALKIAWELLSLKAGLDIRRIREEIPELFIFAAIGTVADRVPLFCENRIIYEEGRKALEWFRPSFVKAFENFRKLLGINSDRMLIEDLIPIVSAGKSTNGENLGVSLLMSEDITEAEELIKDVWDSSNSWQVNAQHYLDQAKNALKMVRNYILLDLGNAEPQYLGYVAGQLKDTYNVPVIVMGRREDGVVTAEVRAPYGFNSLDMLNYMSDLFIDYGGHKPASGFSMFERDIPELYEQIEAYFKEHPFESTSVNYDVEYSNVDESLLDALSRLGNVGVEIRVLFNNVNIGDLREALKKYTVLDPENLLDLYSAEKKVKTLIVSTALGLKVERVIPIAPS